MRTLIRWCFYPLCWIITIICIALFMQDVIDPKTALIIKGGTLFTLCFLIEHFFAYEKRWSMTLPTFISDLKFLVLNGISMRIFSLALALFTISISENNQGMASDWPLLVQVVVGLLIFEAFNYSLHRLMHEGKGKFGKFLWRSHAAHHLSPRLYLLMHGVFHPINAAIIQGLAIITPIWFMGYSENAVTIFFMVMGMHGLLTHFNVDIRIGFLNRIFVGTELHRYHHSADVNESKNYGATLSIYDQLFGTFVYHPGIPPKELGVDDSLNYPDYDNTWAVLKMPFNKQV